MESNPVYAIPREIPVYHKSVKTGGSDNWGTPRELYETLDREFGFTLDPCATADNATAPRFYSPEENGLLQSWRGERIFCNPPHSEIKSWAQKCYEESLRGTLVVCLVPARTGSQWFREYMAPGEVRFLSRRLRFLLPNGDPAPHSAGFDSAVVVLGPGREPVTYYWDWEEEPILPEVRKQMIKGANRERPALRFYGSKFRIGPWIISHFPENYRELHYIEPFGGSGAVLLRKDRSSLETYNDLDSSLVTFFRVLRKRPNELIRSLELTPYSREEYQLSLLALIDPSENEIESARLFFVRLWQSIGGAPGRYSSGWKVMRNKNGRYSMATDSFNRAIGNLNRIAERFREVQIENIPAPELIRKTDSPESLFYIDPPYLLGTRGSSHSSYAHELTDSDHRELSGILRELSGYVILSGYDSELYRELYPDWERRSIQTLANSGRITEEVLWLNPRLAREGIGEGKSLPVFPNGKGKS